MKKITLLLIAFLCFISFGYSQVLKIPYLFENNSEYADSEIYIAMVGKIGGADVWMNMTNSTFLPMNSSYNTLTGPSWSTPAEWKYANIFTKLSDIQNKTIQIPKDFFAGRIFISFNSPMYLHFHAGGGYAGANLKSSTDPNDGIRWEIIELSWGNSGLFTNTSRVDAYQYPMGIEVNGFTGAVNSNLTYEQNHANAIAGAGIPKYSKVGELLTHDEIMSLWDTNVASNYLICKTTKTHSLDGEPIIEQPSKVDGFTATELDTYIGDIWNTYRSNDLTINIGENGVWTGRVSGDVFNFTDSRDGSVATIYAKPSFINVIEGSGPLAFSQAGGVKYDEDLMIQAQIAAAINRHAINTSVVGSTIQYTHDSSLFFKIKPYNEYVSFFHKENISYNSKTYAFAYDDVGDYSSTIQCTYPTNVKIIIGGLVGKSELLNNIVISPQTTSLYINSTQKFTAQGYDAQNNPFPTNITWSVTNGSGAIDSNGLFTPSTIGPVTIKATDAMVFSTITFDVVNNNPVHTDPCNATAINGEYSYSITNTANPTITFTPTLSGTGNQTCILYLSKTPNSQFSGYNVRPNIPFQITANLGETIYFYYTYSLQAGGENTTLNNKHTATVGDCNPPLGVSNNELKSKIVVYPNPVNGQNVMITGEIENSKILMYSMNGSLIKNIDVDNQKELSINTNGLSRGLYLLKITNKNSSKVKTVKVEIQ